MKFSITNSKTLLTLTLVVVLACTALLFFGYAQKTEAGGGGGTKSVKTQVVDRSNGAKIKSATWNKSFSLSLKHATPQNALRGWLEGVRNPNVTIKYYAKVINVATGKEIPDGSAIPVGTKIRIINLPYKNTDIAWFGTGFASDSPYGNWFSKAARPTWACKSSDFLVSDYANILRGNVRIYAPLNVNPPSVSYSVSGTANLTQHNNNTFTVRSPGTVKPRVTFASTYGKFYYQWKDGGRCNVVPAAMRRSGDMSTAYVMDVPSRSIGFNFTVVNPGQPPNPPEISGPKKRTVGQTGVYTFEATDPDGDDVRYLIDWNMDDAIDARRPTVADGQWTQSGTPLTANRTWNTPGTYTFQARTRDNTGMQSDWASYTVTVVDAVSIDSCGPSQASIDQGQSVTWSANISGGTGSYSYEWVGTEDLESTNRNVNWRYYTSGDHGVILTVTDNGNGSRDELTCDVLEVNDSGLPQCNDGIDNDGDGLVDYPDDPDCTDPNDDNEFPEYVPECSDGIDNDGDGNFDWQEDPDCTGPDDDDEGLPPQCSDGEDNDGDGKTDYPDDPGCADGTDNDETDTVTPPQCSDGLDNDGIEGIDMVDPDCTDPTDDSEYHLPECSDGVDNDGVGGIDMADADCSDPSDDNEGPDAAMSGNITVGSVDAATGDSSLSWSASGANSCYVTSSPNMGTWNGMSNSGTSITLPSGTTRFDLVCEDGGPDTVIAFDNGTYAPTGMSGNITVGSVDAATGDSSLSWSASGANSCYVTSSPNMGTWNGMSNSGTSITLPSGTTRFDLVCEDGGPDTVIAFDNGTYAPTDCGPNFEITADPDFILRGNTVTLEWNLGTCTADAVSCTIKGSGISGLQTVGSLTEFAVQPTGSATYTLTCPLDTATTTVEVEQSGQET